MSIYIALLRGINVGGKNKVRMADLKQLFEGLGFTGVQTYIQSGNVLFRSDEQEKILKKAIEQEIASTFGFEASVVLRTAEELGRVISNCPFTEEEIQQAESSAQVEVLYVSFLTNEPSEEKIKHLDAYSSENDRYYICGRDIYLLFRHSIRDSKLAGSIQKLDVPATVRNWKTVSKLSELAKSIA